MTRRRNAFTLLEVLLSAAISALLLAGLYVAVDAQISHAQTGRDLIEHGTVARSLLQRMAADIQPSLAPPLPTSSSAAGSGGNTAGGAAAPATGGAAATGGTATDPAMASSSTPQFNLSVQGDATRLVLIVSKLSTELNPRGDADEQPVVSDQRRITWWLVESGGTAGLARQEIGEVTSEEAANSVPPDVPDELSYVIADEVRSLEFSYFDGSNWLDSWDGMAAGSDGVTPQGPPKLIAIVIGIARQDGTVQTYRHVVAVPTANGTAATTDATQGQ